MGSQLCSSPAQGMGGSLVGESFADAVMSQEDSQASAACQTFTGSYTVLLQDQRGFSCSTLALIFDLGGTVFLFIPHTVRLMCLAPVSFIKLQ